jgi:hypothetical protein
MADVTDVENAALCTWVGKLHCGGDARGAAGCAGDALSARCDSHDASARRLHNVRLAQSIPIRNRSTEMTNTSVGQIELSIDELTTVTGGWKVPGWVKTAGEIAAPALLANPVTLPAGIALSNKKALGHGAIWGAGGAIAGAAGGPEGAALGGTGGFLAGYYDSIYSQHGG